MTFLHPWVLLLLSVPIVLLWTVIGRRPGVTLPFDHHPHRERRVLRWVLGAFETAPLLLLAAGVLMLAGPQMMKKPHAERLLTNVQICMDVSGSMTGYRYEMASNAIRDFTLAREGDAFGLTLFGSYQIRWIPLTRDLKAIRNAMAFADPARQPPHMGGTSIGAALRFCMSNIEAESEEGDRMIILVSDGDSFDLGNGESDRIGEELLAARITLYHIHVAETDIPQEVVDIARATGGEALSATDAQSLQAVFRHIDRMTPARFTIPGTVPLDHFRPFAIAALIAAGAHTLGLLGMRYTPW